MKIQLSCISIQEIISGYNKKEPTWIISIATPFTL